MGVICASFHVPGHVKAEETIVKIYPDGVFISKPTKENYIYVCNC